MRKLGLALLLFGSLGLAPAQAQNFTMPPPAGVEVQGCVYSTSPPTLSAGPAFVQCGPGGTTINTGSYFTNVPGSTLTRASNTTTYTANTTVCLAASVTPCAPITIPIANANAGKGLINRVTLLKSGSTTSNAQFTIWFFSAAPGVASPSQFDNAAYSGPRTADMPNYIGNAVCSTGTATSDTSAGVWYECTLSNPNTAGVLDFQALSGSININALISATAAYAPASAETFNVFVSGLY